MRLSFLPLAALVADLPSMVAGDDAVDEYVGIFSRFYAGVPAMPSVPMAISQGIGKTITEKTVEGVVRGGINALLKNGEIPQFEIQDHLYANTNEDTCRVHVSAG